MPSLIFLLGSLAASIAAAETTHGVLVFSRHGDRTAKFYPDYQMTNLGATQVFDSGSFYRQRYVEAGAPNQIAGLSPDRAVYGQVYASAPDQSVLFQTAVDFLQGLYPPLGRLADQALEEETLTNGTDVADPLDGYQYIHVHGEGDTDPDTIWIKGDDSCPAYDEAVASYSSSTAFKSTLRATRGLYDSVVPLLGKIMGGEAAVTYADAYNVFDLLNVASIHNVSVARRLERVDPSTLDRLRYLANEWEWNNNFNASMPDRSIGGMALAGGILQQLNETVYYGAESNKFTLLAGSYDTFLAFFGLTDLQSKSADFMGLPNYAATMAFELFTEGEGDAFPSNAMEDLNVRFLFRNGSDSAEQLTPWALFGQDRLTMPYGEFVDELSSRAIMSVGEWCKRCQSTEEFCVAYTAGDSTSEGGSSAASNQSGSSGLSLAAAGGIGAAVTLVVCTLLFAGIWVFARRNKKSASSHAAAASSTRVEKGLSDSDSNGSPERT